MTAGLILAGGSSERLSELEIPKQFAEIAGIPLIMHCLRTFQHCADVDALAVVAPQQWHEQIRSWLDGHGISKFETLAPPGRTRQHSILNGLLSLEPLSPARVLVHDAVRPLVTEQDITDCIHACEGYDGATPAMPLNETVYRSVDGSVISALLARDELFAGQTPECYHFTKYLEAHRALSDAELGAVRGSSEIAFSAGMKIHLHRGNPNNVKVTTIADFEYIKYLMEVRSL